MPDNDNGNKELRTSRTGLFFFAENKMVSNQQKTFPKSGFPFPKHRVGFEKEYACLQWIYIPFLRLL
jgi:hypothetical protein